MSGGSLGDDAAQRVDRAAHERFVVVLEELELNRLLHGEIEAGLEVLIRRARDRAAPFAREQPTEQPFALEQALVDVALARLDDARGARRAGLFLLRRLGRRAFRGYLARATARVPAASRTPASSDDEPTGSRAPPGCDGAKRRALPCASSLADLESFHNMPPGVFKTGPLA